MQEICARKNCALCPFQVYDVMYNGIFADTAIPSPLKMYGILQGSVQAMPSEDRQMLVAKYIYLSLNFKKKWHDPVLSFVIIYALEERTALQKQNERH